MLEVIKTLLPDAVIALGHFTSEGLWKAGRFIHDKGHDPLNYLHDKVTGFADDIWSLSELVDKKTEDIERSINRVRI